MFIDTPDLIKALEQDGAGVHADVFKRGNAAYNAGPARYDEYLATGRPLPPETQVYIAMLSPMIGDRQSDDRTVASFDLIAWARATLFASHPEAPPDAELPAAKVQPDRLPSVRRIVDLSALSPQSEGLFVHLASGDRPQ